MTEEQHLSVDAIADLLDGSMPAAEAMSANSHVETCDACAALRDDQAFVASLLAEEAADLWTMPLDVSAALDAALTRAADEQATAPATLEQVRRQRAARPMLRWLAGAAAAVAVFGIGAVGWQALNTGHGRGVSNSANDYNGAPAINKNGGQGLAVGGEPSTSQSTDKLPPIVGGEGGFLTPVHAAQVPTLARRLAARPGQFGPITAIPCAKPITGGVTAGVLWKGHAAVLALNTSTRTATIFDCTTGGNALYTHGY